MMEIRNHKSWEDWNKMDMGRRGGGKIRESEEKGVMRGVCVKG